MTQVIRLLLVMVLFHAVVGSAVMVQGSEIDSGESGNRWQLVLTYDSHEISLLKAEPIDTLRKSVVSPGLNSALLRIPVRVIWSDDAGVPVQVVPTELPVGRIGACNLEDAVSVGGGIPDQGTMVVRLEGPSQGSVSGIRIEPLADRCDLELPVSLTGSSGILSLPEIGAYDFDREGLIGWEKVLDNGPDDNRLVMAVLSEGYTEDDLSAGFFSDDLQQFVLRHLQNYEPWDDLSRAMNVYRIDVASVEQGIDNDPCGTFVDTYFNSIFANCDFDMELAGDGNAKVYNLADQVIGVGVWDRVVVLINTHTYSAYGGQPLLMTVDNYIAQAGVFIHEFGHAFNGLGDEYGGSCFVPFWQSPNVSMYPDLDQLPWPQWIEPGTPLPTPNTSAYEGVVGAFLGAHFCDTRFYRPWRQCLMRYVPDEFCPVCKESTILYSLGSLDYIDDLTPPTGSDYPLDIQGATFSLDPLEIDNLTFTWYLNEVPLPDQYGPDCLVTAVDLLTAGWTQTTLRAEVGYASSAVRLPVPTENHIWQVSVDESVTGIGSVPGSEGFTLHSPSPNPSSGGVSVAFSIEKPTRVNLTVYDIRGRLVSRLISNELRSGERVMEWDGYDQAGARLTGGVYLVRLDTDLGSQTRRVVLLR